MNDKIAKNNKILDDLLDNLGKRRKKLADADTDENIKARDT